MTLLEQHAGDAGGEEGGDGAPEHGADTEGAEEGTFFGGEDADAADLDADGGEVGKTAEGIGGDDDGFFVEEESGVAGLGEGGVGDEFVDDHLFAEEGAEDEDVLAGDADDPGDGGEDEAHDGLHGEDIEAAIGCGGDPFVEA